MLKNDEIILWAHKQQITSNAEKLLNQIRNSKPSRRVSSGCGSVSGRFPSRKMGVTIQFESHRNELAFICELEQDINVLEYYDQPPQIPLRYKNHDGKNIGFNHTPDFFVIREDWGGWIECKTEERLLQLAVTQPSRFYLDETGAWRCPPGEKYASQFGLGYKVWSSKNINRTYQRNIEYLEDYFRADIHLINDSVRQRVFTETESKLGITLLEIYEQLEGQVTRDDVLASIAHREIIVDLYESPLSEPELVKVFISNEAAQAYSNIFRLDVLPSEKSLQA